MCISYSCFSFMIGLILNTAVMHINMRLEDALMTDSIEHIAMVPVETIKRLDFTRHTLHLNVYEKGRLAKLTGNSILGDRGVTYG